MSGARYERLVALAKQADRTFVLTPETDAVLRAVATDIDDARMGGDALWAGYFLGLMVGSDGGAAFTQLTNHVTGIEFHPSLAGIESLLSTLRDKFEKGWRLVPPPEEPAE